VSLLVNSIAVVIASYIIPNVSLDGYQTALIVALLLGLINTFVKPIFKILTLPINILTLGLFSFLLNGLFILIISNYVSGFRVDGFLYAVLYSVMLSIVTSILRIFLK